MKALRTLCALLFILTTTTAADLHKTNDSASIKYLLAANLTAQDAQNPPLNADPKKPYQHATIADKNAQQPQSVKVENTEANAPPAQKTTAEHIIERESDEGSGFGISANAKSASGHSTLEIENKSAFESPIEAAKAQHSVGLDLTYQLHPSSTTQINFFAGYGVELNSERAGYTRAYHASTSPESGLYDAGSQSITAARTEYLGVKIIIKKRHRIAITYKNIANVGASDPVFGGVFDDAVGQVNKALAQFGGANNNGVDSHAPDLAGANLNNPAHLGGAAGSGVSNGGSAGHNHASNAGLNGGLNGGSLPPIGSAYSSPINSANSTGSANYSPNTEPKLPTNGLFDNYQAFVSYYYIF